MKYSVCNLIFFCVHSKLHMCVLSSSCRAFNYWTFDECIYYIKDQHKI
jgi:hypothetical protein